MHDSCDGREGLEMEGYRCMTVVMELRTKDGGIQVHDSCDGREGLEMEGYRCMTVVMEGKD